jgi:flagellar protein FliO/FliZ
MFDSLFGAEMPLAVRFFLAFVIVLALIGVTAWAVRRFGSGRLGANTRGRQPRLAVIDYASVDGRRRLILVRRDNVEHLLMIGGPTDVVVEPNIVRATAAPRDVPAARPTAGVEALTRAIPLPENSNGGSWPLAPEPNGNQRPSPRLDSPRLDSPRLEPLPDELPARPFQPAAETPARPQRDTLAALADELSPPRSAVPRKAPAIEPRQEPRPEPRVELRKPITPPAPPAIQPAAPATPAGAEPATADQSLADMAQRLEAALRKPNAPEARSPAAPSRAAPAVEQTQPADAALPSPPPRPPRPGETKPARSEPNQGKTPFDNLEQEMASLLGRSNKT